MTTMTTQGQRPWQLIKRAFGLAPKPVPAPRPGARAAAYDDFFALQSRKGPRPAPKK